MAVCLSAKPPTHVSHLAALPYSYSARNFTSVCRRFYAQERDTRPLLPAAAHRSGSDEVEDGSTPVSTSAAKPSSRFIVKLTLLSILGGLLFGELGGVG